MRMERLPLEELVAIADPLTEHDFEPEYVSAARAELATRGDDGVETDEAFTHHAKLRADGMAKGELALSKLGWVFFLFMGPFLVVSVGGAVGLLVMGYSRKSSDAFLAIVASFIVWFMVVGGIVLIGETLA